MKKIFTSILLLTGGVTFSQSIAILDDSLNVISNSIYDVTITPGSSKTTEVLVANLSASAKSIRCLRTIFLKDVQDSTQFCWGGLCYNYSQNLSGLSQNINANDTINFFQNGFHGIFIAGPSTMVRLVHYKFYDNANPTDSTGVTIRYTSVLGVDENTASAAVSNAFPNPASSVMSLHYDLTRVAGTGRLMLFDMLGKKVKELELTDRQGTAKVNVADLNAGLYFYSVTVDGKAITTRKLVITK